MKHKAYDLLDSYHLHDLRKIAHRVQCTSAHGVSSRSGLLEALKGEMPSMLMQAMDGLDLSALGEPCAQAESYLGFKSAQGSSTAVEVSDDVKKLIESLQEMVRKTQEGVARFAEDVDSRVEKAEAIGRMLLEKEPLRIEVSAASSAVEAGPSKQPRLAGTVHKEFPTLLSMAKAKVNILMVGPAGSGKTTAAEMLAKALGIPFCFNGAIDTEYKLKGFVDAQGRLVSTEFRKAFEHGGVYLFDEVDASLPGATMAFNAALANGWCDFPDGRVVKHPDTVIIAAANTYMGGATFEYVGRNKQDAAFVDRFLTLTWDVDEALETVLCPDASWVKHVQRVRANARKKGLKVIVSPRASIEGAKLLAQGLPWDFVEKSAIKKGMTDEQWDAVK